MKVGFTGSSEGMTALQKLTLLDTLRTVLPRLVEFHHGDCIGADATAHDMAVDLGYAIVIHPPVNPKKRAFKKEGVILPEKPYLDRNRDIVDAVELLLAAPNSMMEQVRGSGTWATIRYARRLGKCLVIFKPDGRTAKEGQLKVKEE